MRIFEGFDELGPYPSVVPESLESIPPSIEGGLRDSIVCNPCNGPMYWEGEVEHWSCPTCPNKKTLIKRVTPKEQAQQLGLGEKPPPDYTDWRLLLGMTVVGVVIWYYWVDVLWERRTYRGKVKRKKDLWDFS